ncbi:hypothetical protein [Streptomyces sp900116325]|uniref:hypothetical protein n=1 Tax=Streptomyces sp. 900116325 TaxID=3154295 RepID=UPI0033BFB3BE
MTQRGTIRWNGDVALAAMRQGAALGVRLAAEHVLTESRRLVPIEEATLERSGVATVDEANLTAAVSYDTPYAVRQHEELNYRHDAGRTAKYLERPLLDEADTATALIAAQVRRALR